MKLPSLVLSAALSAALLAPVPALANDASEDGPGELAERLGDPEVQRSMAGALAALTDAMMNIDLAPFAAVVESTGDRRSARRLRNHGTLRELAGRDADRVPEEMARRLPQMMGMMAGMAGAMEQMLPQLREMGERMGTAMGEAVEREVEEAPAGEATEE